MYFFSPPPTTTFTKTPFNRESLLQSMGVVHQEYATIIFFEGHRIHPVGDLSTQELPNIIFFNHHWAFVIHGELRIIMKIHGNRAH